MKVNKYKLVPLFWGLRAGEVIPEKIKVRFRLISFSLMACALLLGAAAINRGTVTQLFILQDISRLQLIFFGLAVLSLLMALQGWNRLAAVILVSDLFLNSLSNILFFGFSDIISVHNFITTFILAVQIFLSLKRKFYLKLIYNIVSLSAVVPFIWFMMNVNHKYTEYHIKELGGIIGMYLVCIALVPAINNSVNIFKSLLDIHKTTFTEDITGFPNLKKLRFDIEEKEAGTPFAGAEFVLLGIQIRGIEKINRTYGFARGDAVLRKIMEEMHGFLTLTRFYHLNGNSFVLVPEPYIDISRIHGDILEIIKRPVELGGGCYTLSCIVTATHAPYDGELPEELVRNLQNSILMAAEKGMYNQIVWFDSQYFTSMEKKFFLETLVQKALRDDGFTISLQPKYDIRKDQILGAECLARLTLPTGEKISPADFIPIIESSGMIKGFTYMILEKCLELRSEIMKLHTKHPLSLAVNISPSLLRDEVFIEHFLDCSARFLPLKLELELTEEVILKYDETSAGNIGKLKKAGVRISIDDFGTGYSNLEQLRKIEVDEIKIDKQFVTDMEFNKSSAEICEAIIQLGKIFGLRIVAEGVENWEQFLTLGGLGCDAIQGFGISAPLPPEEFFKFYNLIAEKGLDGEFGKQTCGKPRRFC